MQKLWSQEENLSLLWQLPVPTLPTSQTQSVASQGVTKNAQCTLHPYSLHHPT